MLRESLQNALWGAFIGDALGMPSHWYYSPEELEAAFPEGINWYQAPPHPHPQCFMVGVRYRPDIITATTLGRQFDILHDHARFYRTTYSRFGFETTEREAAHGNTAAKPPQRYHYHHGLQAGENTLGADLLRVLMRSVVAHEGYSQKGFLDDFVEFMTTPGNVRDPYRETYLRKWFEAFSRGTAPENCGEHQRHRWSIASHGGMIRPLVLSLLTPDNPPLATGMAVTHQQLTHRSEMVSAGLSVVVPMLLRLIGGEDIATVIRDTAPHVRMPELSGEDLGREYRAARGPGNISQKRMWEMHMTYKGPDAQLLGAPGNREQKDLPGPYARACYPEHGLPLMLRIAHYNQGDLYRSLCDNASIGGDTVHRGMILGLLLGAATSHIDPALKKGLIHHDRIEEDINRFVDVITSGKGHLAV